MNNPHNIYIHVPFCISKCNYCAFFSSACKNPDWDEYERQIVGEISYWANTMGRISVPTIFFGGGTPSLMPAKTLERILNKIRSEFNLDSDIEITLESNPGTIDSEKLSDFCSVGINRLSVGIQSLDDDKLHFLGRKHTAHDALKLIDCAMQKHIRLSGDFIYGMPGEDVSDIIKLCEQINSIGLKHCSLYELTIEKNTPFGKMKLEMPDNQTMADMYIAIQNNLKLSRYEVSNYANENEHCKHNQNIWDGGAYIGIGNGAAGRVFLNNTWYEQMGNNAIFQPIDNNARAIEKVLTGMRTIRGVELSDDVKNVIDLGFAKSVPDMLRFTNNNRIVATDAGIMILDEIITKLVK
ncbi:MAG: radical SAM family heme chaperone HemW [Alphaproteobacteria bacterium]|nr:radical SAM family heme chaperone HemW [Alphaproteobacteria bacterium]